MMWLMLKKYGLQVALLLVLMSIIAFAYREGYLKAEARYQAEIAQMVSTQQTEALAAEQAYSQALKKAQAEQRKWQDFAQHQSQQLALASRELDKQKGRLKQEIHHAIQQDNSSGNDCHNGLGTHSVQLYNQALGYTD